jgi:hypothetical protein
MSSFYYNELDVSEREERFKMRLVLQRKWATEVSTIGELLIDGRFECYTLEDAVRTGPKVPGKTAIPAGTYKVIIDMSTRFKKLMPHILDVKGFSGVRIHSGNTSENTEGCPITGRIRKKDYVGESKLAFDVFFAKLQAAKETTIQILDVPVESSESVLNDSSIQTSANASRSDLLKSLFALIASFLGSILPQPKQP